MFSRFNLSDLKEEFFGGEDACAKYQSYYQEEVLPLMENGDHSIREYLELYMQSNGNLDASEMEKEWFPSVLADIFLSHSHDDERLVEGFAGWLYKHCKVVAFVDSSLWGYADELLLKIDNRYCKSNTELTYDYKMRNASTSRVHMILMTALAKMIDKTECLIFVNTPRSISIENTISNTSKTYSPWIYSELALSKIIRRRKPEHCKHTEFSYTNESQDTIPMEFPAEVEHLDTLTTNDLVVWKNSIEYLNTLNNYIEYIRPRSMISPISGRQSLDRLYRYLLSSEV